MSLYNLSDNVNDNFQFQVEGKRYSMRYPLVKEVEELKSVQDDLEQAKRDKNDTLVEELENKLEDVMYSYISGDDEGQEDIRAVMDRQNVKVMQNFGKMIQAELGLGK